MSDLDLDAIEARAEAATPEPWRALTTGVRGGDHWYVCDQDQSVALIHASDGEDEEQREPDAEFIAHARTDVPALVREVRHLRTVVDAALEMTDPDFNPIPVRQVRGRAGWKFAMEHVRAAVAAADPAEETP